MAKRLEAEDELFRIAICMTEEDVIKAFGGPAGYDGHCRRRREARAQGFAVPSLPWRFSEGDIGVIRTLGVADRSFGLAAIEQHQQRVSGCTSALKATEILSQ